MSKRTVSQMEIEDEDDEEFIFSAEHAANTEPFRMETDYLAAVARHESTATESLVDAPSHRDDVSLEPNTKVSRRRVESVMCAHCHLATVSPEIPLWGAYTIRDGLEPNKLYLWCSCGRSKQQPFCDGRGHLGTGFSPIPFKVKAEEQTIYSLCGCKHTQNPPYCDATHTKMRKTDTPCKCSRVPDW